MRIFYSEESDPMLLDTKEGLRKLRQRFDSSGSRETFQAEVSGDPAPYSEFLKGIRVYVVEGETKLYLAPDRWLDLQISPAEIKVLGHQLEVDEDGAHNHWYTVPVSLIIEADDSWTE